MFDSACSWRDALLRAACFAGAITIDDPRLGQIVRRHLDLDPIAEQNFDAVAAQAAGDMREDRVPVLQFYREGRAGKDLFDGAEELERSFLRRVGRAGGGVPRGAGTVTTAT